MECSGGRGLLEVTAKLSLDSQAGSSHKIMGEGGKDIPGAGEGSPLFPETHVARCNPNPGISSRKLARLCRALLSWNPHITWMGVGTLLSPHFTERETGAQGGVPRVLRQGCHSSTLAEPLPCQSCRAGRRRGPLFHLSLSPAVDADKGLEMSPLLFPATPRTRRHPPSPPLWV